MSSEQRAMSKEGRKNVNYAFIDSHNLNLGARNNIINSLEKLAFVSYTHGVLKEYNPQRQELNKKNQPQRSVETLGLAGHGDADNIAKKANRARKRGQS